MNVSALNFFHTTQFSLSFAVSCHIAAMPYQHPKGSYFIATIYIGSHILTYDTTKFYKKELLYMYNKYVWINSLP